MPPSTVASLLNELGNQRQAAAEEGRLIPGQPVGVDAPLEWSGDDAYVSVARDQ